LRPITTAWSAFVKSTDSTFLSRDEVVHEDGDEPAQRNSSDITQ
jgi:hypothetical protein